MTLADIQREWTGSMRNKNAYRPNRFTKSRQKSQPIPATSSDSAESVWRYRLIRGAKRGELEAAKGKVDVDLTLVLNPSLSQEEMAGLIARALADLASKDPGELRIDSPTRIATSVADVARDASDAARERARTRTASSSFK